ncbi:MAG: AAA family ATPase [Spirochaetes bacterium]|nr:AAA family ATPase [Spirochaetota bacterium]
MQANVDIKEITEEVKEASQFVKKLMNEMSKVIVGQQDMLFKIIMGMLCDGHILLEGVPGLAKTLTIRSFADAIEASFKRIQFTPDLLPADIVGTDIYSQKTGEFTTKKGPIFANIILADEINRSPAKVQSALLEAMQEHQVTIGEETFPLEEPFMVLATENPIEQEGTYPLPEAQVDRFMMKIMVGYPSKDEEKRIVERMSTGKAPKCKSVVTTKDIIKARQTVERIYIEDKIIDYIMDIIFATRKPKEYGLEEGFIDFGASPRASIYLTKLAKAHAFVRGRAFVTPEDVRVVGYDVLRHRIMLSYEAEAENVSADAVIAKIFDLIEVP